MQQHLKVIINLTDKRVSYCLSESIIKKVFLVLNMIVLN